MGRLEAQKASHTSKYFGIVRGQKIAANFFLDYPRLQFFLGS